MNIKDTIKGIILALIAAYFFPIFLMALGNPWSNPVGSFVVIPLMGLLFSFWFVIPIGVILGNLAPYSISHHSRAVSTIYGLLAGLLVGLVGRGAWLSIVFCANGGLNTSLYDLLKAVNMEHFRVFIISFSGLSLYSTVWIVGYICLSGRKSSQNAKDLS